MWRRGRCSLFSSVQHVSEHLQWAAGPHWDHTQTCRDVKRHRWYFKLKYLDFSQSFFFFCDFSEWAVSFSLTTYIFTTSPAVNGCKDFVPVLPLCAGVSIRYSKLLNHVSEGDETDKTQKHQDRTTLKLNAYIRVKIRYIVCVQYINITLLFELLFTAMTSSHVINHHVD